MKKKKSKNHERNHGGLGILLGGAGGQGILTLGKVLATAGINCGLEVSCLPAYGAEMRGGYVYCTLVFSSGRDLASPVVSQADIGVFMNDASFQMLAAQVRHDGFLVLNSSLVRRKPEKGFRTIALPATEITESLLGGPQAANMVMGGAVACLMHKLLFPLTQKDLCFGIREVMAKKEARRVSQEAASIGWSRTEAAWKEARPARKS